MGMSKSQGIHFRQTTGQTGFFIKKVADILPCVWSAENGEFWQ